MANVLLNLAVSAGNLIIEQKFLEPGHTQMEVDSVHATIEQNLKGQVINLPADYVPVCQKPRNFNAIQHYKTIRPGRAKGDLKDLQAIKKTAGKLPRIL